jgi:hypothetical protein
MSPLLGLSFQRFPHPRSLLHFLERKHFTIAMYLPLKSHPTSNGTEQVSLAVMLSLPYVRD